MTEHDVKDLSLAPAGTLTIEWAEQSMPVLGRERFDELTPAQEECLSSWTHGT
jgi:hypothetical protein